MRSRFCATASSIRPGRGLHDIWGMSNVTLEAWLSLAVVAVFAAHRLALRSSTRLHFSLSKGGALWHPIIRVTISILDKLAVLINR